MSERRVKLPEAAEKFVVDNLSPAERGLALLGARKLARWLVANPQAPTDEQKLYMFGWMQKTGGGKDWDCLIEFQRSCLFAPAEPEDPVADLKVPLTESGNVAWSPVNAVLHNQQVDEAFQRGQQSMIKKEKQP